MLVCSWAFDNTKDEIPKKIIFNVRVKCTSRHDSQSCLMSNYVAFLSS